MSSQAQTPIPGTSRGTLQQLHSEEEIIHAYRQVTCPICRVSFENRFRLHEHIYAVHPEFYSTQIGEVVSEEEEQITVHPVLQTHNVSTTYKARMEEYPCFADINENTFFKKVQSSSIECIKADILKWKNLRVFFNMEFSFAREQNGILATKPGYFTSFSHLLFSNAMIPRVWGLMTHHVTSFIEDFTGLGMEINFHSEIRICDNQVPICKNWKLYSHPLRLNGISQVPVKH